MSTAVFDLLASPVAPSAGPSVARRRVPQSSSMRMVRARYDAAQTTDDNRKHWAFADGLSASAANSPGIRAMLRNRARYEYANNTYAKGMVDTLAREIIGIGPRLQMQTGDRRLNEAIERLWSDWARRTKLTQKLITARVSRCVDGEAFVIRATNGKINHPVKLDLQLIEADRVTDSYGASAFVSPGDGIIYDDWGNPLSYRVLRYHPGDRSIDLIRDSGFDSFPADSVYHMFAVDRPGQLRGIPEIMSALPLFSMLRRWTLAVIRAAEAAADLAGVIQTQQPDAGDEDGEEVIVGEPYEPVELDRGMFTVLPDGSSISQFKAEQPGSTYEAGKAAILREIARCLGMPYNVAAADSSGYNYASGRLDHAMFDRTIEIDRHDMETVLLESLVENWLTELELVRRSDPSILPSPITSYQHEWQWRGRDHADPTKEASADHTRIGNGTLTIPDYYAKRGLDWEAEQAQSAASFGVTVDEYRQLLRQKLFGSASAVQQNSGQPNDNDETEEDDDA